MTGTVRLRPPRHPLDPRAVTWWTTRSALVGLPVVSALVVAAVLAATPWVLVPAVVLAAAACAAVVVLPRWWYRLHRWEVTETAVYTRSGYLWQEWRVAPMSRIQTVDTVRGPVQRLFGLATVTVTTASAKGALEIRGLDAEQAAQLAEELTHTAQAVAGDAT